MAAHFDKEISTNDVIHPHGYRLSRIRERWRLRMAHHWSGLGHMALGIPGKKIPPSGCGPQRVIPKFGRRRGILSMSRKSVVLEYRKMRGDGVMPHLRLQPQC